MELIVLTFFISLLASVLSGASGGGGALIDTVLYFYWTVSTAGRGYGQGGWIGRGRWLTDSL